MAKEIQNLGYISLTPNPRPQNKRGYHIDDAHTQTQTISRSQPSRNQAPSRSHTLCTESLSRSPKACAEPRPRFRTSSSISLSHSRLIHIPSQSSQDSITPLEVSQEIHTWLQKHGLGGYLCVIDTPSSPRSTGHCGTTTPGHGHQ